MRINSVRVTRVWPSNIKNVFIYIYTLCTCLTGSVLKEDLLLLLFIKYSRKDKIFYMVNVHNFEYE